MAQATTQTKDFTAQDIDDALIAWGYDRPALIAWCKTTYGVKGENIVSQTAKLSYRSEAQPYRALIADFKKANARRETFDTWTEESAPPARATADEVAPERATVDPETGEIGPAFDPRQFITRVQGDTPYLEVKWKVKWLRAEHPDAVIETRCIEISDAHAVFKAKVSIPSLGASAEGHARETKAGFADYAEKAETSAIGRALGFLGYDLEFLPDAQPTIQQPRRTSTRERR